MVQHPTKNPFYAGKFGYNPFLQSNIGCFIHTQRDPLFLLIVIISEIMKYDISFCMELDGKLKSLGEVYMNRSVASIVHESFVVCDFNYISQIMRMIATYTSSFTTVKFHTTQICLSNFYFS